MDPNLSPAQVRNRLILAARRIVAEHWPRQDDRCPVCRIPNCRALTVATDYLNSTGPPPPQKRTQRPAADSSEPNQVPAPTRRNSLWHGW